MKLCWKDVTGGLRQQVDLQRAVDRGHPRLPGDLRRVVDRLGPELPHDPWGTCQRPEHDRWLPFSDDAHRSLR
jgi:hypothetical protein